MQCQVVTNSECSNYRHCFQSEIAQFPRMRSPLLQDKKNHTELDRCRWQSSLCAMWLILSMRVCACWCKTGSCCIDGVTLSDRKWILPACAPIGTTIIPIPGRLGECKPHQTVRVTNWWARCGAVLCSSVQIKPRSIIKQFQMKKIRRQVTICLTAAIMPATKISYFSVSTQGVLGGSCIDKRLIPRVEDWVTQQDVCAGFIHCP